MTRYFLRAWALASMLASAACVSHDAGLRTVRSELSSRADFDLRVSHEPSPADAALVRRLLEKPLTAESAATLAIANNAEVRAALADVEVSRGALASALALPNPKTELGLSLRRSELSSGELEVSLDITELLLLPARERPASAELDAAALEATGRALDVAFAAKAAFYEYQAAAQSLELEKSVLYAAAQSRDLGQRLLDAGNVPDVEALVEDAMYQEARVAVARAELEVETRREQLNGAMGLFGEAGQAWKVEARLADPTEVDTAGLESRAVAANLDLRVLEARHAAAAGRVDLAQLRGALPELEAGFGAEREEGEWSMGPRIGLTVPLFYQGQGEVTSARGQLAGAVHRHDAVATRVRAQARAVSARLRAARESAAFHAGTLLPMRKRILEATLRQYNAMSTGPLQVLAAKRDELMATSAHVAALRDYWIARTEVEALLAGRSLSTTPTSAVTPRAAAPATDTHG